MSLAWSPRGGALLFVALAGCRSGEAGSLAPGGTDAGGTNPAPLVFEVALGVTCADDAGAGGICVAPSQLVTFGLQGPAGSVVTLSLEGAYADAALTVGQLTLTATAAQVTLESSSVTAQFSVVATAQVGLTAERAALPVVVARSGSATIEASGVYGGRRNASELYATDTPLSTCAELTANASDAGTDAGSQAWTSGPSGVAIGLSAPAGERVAVGMRIGHYAFGCADVNPLAPEATLALPVPIYDVPMALSLTDLTAIFTFTPDATASSMWGAISRAAIARVEAAFFASGAPDGSALLDAMRGAISGASDQAEFSAARAAGGWDTTAGDWLSAHPPSLATRAERWLADTESARSLGPLVAIIGNGTPAGTAPFTVVGFGALSATSAGLAQPSPFQWTADANDTVHLSGAIDLRSTPLLAHEADLQAAAATPNTSDVPTAIALGIDCAGLAAAIVGAGVSYGTCDAQCTGALCAEALAAAWTTAAAADANGADAVHTVITASAPATVGDFAEPASVQGGWLGSVSGAGVPVDAGVDADAAAPAFAISGSFVATEPNADGATTSMVAKRKLPKVD